MIYFDSAYIVKCYLSERGSDAVRRLAESGEATASCELARAEFSAAVHRHRRERKITDREAAAVFRRFREDCLEGYWTWFPLTSRLVEECCSVFEALPPDVFLRTADALHLACAKAQGFKTLYTNDEHLQSAASHFGVTAVDVTSG